MRKTKISQSSIGVFDSGLGGLTVVKELIRQLPDEQIVYFGDTARVPYGTKSKESIIKFSLDNARVLLKHRVKCIVVACNSSSSYAIKTLKQEFSVPIIGVILPGAKKAVAKTANKRIGVIATNATVKSSRYVDSILKQDGSIKVFQAACPLFVPLVEEGWLDTKVTALVVREYLQPLIDQRIDTLILGCTHYPLLKDVLQKAMTKKVFLVDSAFEVAQEVKRVLSRLQLDRVSEGKPRHQFFVSDKPQAFNQIAKNFLGWDIKAKIVKED